MICDTCTKARVCQYKENCNILERDVAGSKIENIITLEVRCNQKETRLSYNGTTQSAKAFTHEAQTIASMLGI